MTEELKNLMRTAWEDGWDRMVTLLTNFDDKNWERCRKIEEIERKKGFFKIKGDENDKTD